MLWQPPLSRCGPRGLVCLLLSLTAISAQEVTELAPLSFLRVFSGADDVKRELHPVLDP
jgi:hypothetical protein